METNTSLEQRGSFDRYASIKVMVKACQLNLVLTKCKGGKMIAKHLNTFERVSYKRGLENGVMQAVSFHKDTCLNRKESRHFKAEVAHCSFAGKRLGTQRSVSQFYGQLIFHAFLKTGLKKY